MDSPVDTYQPQYEPRLHVVLFQPEIPPNTGAVGRTCVAIGAKLWLVKPLGFQLNTKTLRRAGLDYWKHLEWETVSQWEELQAKLPGHRFWFFSKFATQSYTVPKYSKGDVLVFGSESRGLPEHFRTDYESQMLAFPMRPQVRSINLSCSVAVACYEATRQLDLAHPSD